MRSEAFREDRRLGTSARTGDGLVTITFVAGTFNPALDACVEQALSTG
ncbi:MAG TPA: hypothetical protein VI462_13230 [Acidimicrobiia bacterium]